MANNYSRATMEPTEVFLTDTHRAFLQASGAGFELQTDPSALEMLADTLVEGPALARRFYVFWEDYFCEEVDDCQLDEAFEELGLPAGSELDRLKRLPMEDALREILMQPENADLGYLQIQGAFTCSKMRPGEFGGFNITVTRNEYCWVNTGSVYVRDGKIEPHQITVHKFKED